MYYVKFFFFFFYLEYCFVHFTARLRNNTFTIFVSVKPTDRQTDRQREGEGAGEGLGYNDINGLSESVPQQPW